MSVRPRSFEEIKKEEELKKDFKEKLFKILNVPKGAGATTIGPEDFVLIPSDPTTDEDFLRLMLLRFLDYYRQWKTGLSSDPNINAFKEKLESSPKETKGKANTEQLLSDLLESSPKETNDKANPKLLLEDLLKLSDNRIEHLEKLLEKKIELIKSI